MSFDAELWLEKCQEKLEAETLDYIILDDDCSSDFLCFIDEYLAHKENKGTCEGLMNRMVNAYLKTTAGQEWYAKTLDMLYRDVPEQERESLEDR